MEGLVAAYEASELAAFHRRYEAQEPDPPELWFSTYDRIDLGALPACAARILEHPNDLLLQPGALQLLVRVLLAQGWQARHIAGLIRSRYERPYGWLKDFHFHDPTLRAEVYTRIFAGLIALGHDQAVDFNCTSTQEKRLCPGTGCPLGLSTGAFWRAPLLGCLQPIRDAGFGQIEIASSPSHLDFHDRSACAAAAARIRELGLGVHSFHAPFTDQIDISALDSRARDTAVREISQAAEAAAILEARFFVLHPGPETTGVPRGERLDRMDCAVEALDRIAWRAGELGVRLVLENMLPHLFAGHVRDLLWLLGALATTNVGFCLDTGHAFLSGAPASAARRRGDRLARPAAPARRGALRRRLHPRARGGGRTGRGPAPRPPLR